MQPSNSHFNWFFTKLFFAIKTITRREVVKVVDQTISGALDGGLHVACQIEKKEKKVAYLYRKKFQCFLSILRDMAVACYYDF